jgi:hypothetical protein
VPALLVVLRLPRVAAGAAGGDLSFVHCGSSGSYGIVGPTERSVSITGARTLSRGLSADTEGEGGAPMFLAAEEPRCPLDAPDA